MMAPHLIDVAVALAAGLVIVAILSLAALPQARRGEGLHQDLDEMTVPLPPPPDPNEETALLHPDNRYNGCI